MHRNSLLIVDDQKEILNSLKRIFQRDYDIYIASDGRSALEILKENQISVILSDQRMPEMDGVSFLKEAQHIQPDSIRIMITGYADIEASIKAVNEAKIYQYVSKPFEPDDLILIVKNAVDKYNLIIKNAELQQKLLQENKELKNQVADQLDLGNFVGHSPEMQKIFKLVRKVMNTPTTVLLFGETGTGKEMLARMIHYNSNRKDNLFIAQNCGAIPDTLLQSELFGHVKGAFTGAINDKKGLFEQADNGTVFLDEIGDTTPALQVGLLRVLQEGEIKPLGGSATKKVNVRIIAATNKDLQKKVQDNVFREDLYYRLNVFPICIPPLRERKEDIPELINFFVKKYTKRISKNIEGITQNVIHSLKNAPFPGNVRELENEIERMVTMADDNKPIDVDLLADRFLNTYTVKEESAIYTKLKPAIEHIEKKLIKDALDKTKGNILKSAKILGISRVGLHKMLKRHNIEALQYKD